MVTPSVLGQFLSSHATSTCTHEKAVRGCRGVQIAKCSSTLLHAMPVPKGVADLRLSVTDVTVCRGVARRSQQSCVISCVRDVFFAFSAYRVSSRGFCSDRQQKGHGSVSINITSMEMTAEFKLCHVQFHLFST